MNCERCGAGSRSSLCCECRRKDRVKQRVPIKCRGCGADSTTSALKFKMHEAKGGILCEECRSKIFSETMRATQARFTPEERSANAKLAADQRSTSGSEMVRRQWESIKSDPEAYAKLLRKRSETMRRVWEERSDEEKDRIISTWLVADRRSKGNESLKQSMVEAGLYDGFESEAPIRGFVVDECNEDLKIAIEYFGDGYHCNPYKYRDPDQFLKHTGRTVGEQWKRDARKIAALRNYGYDVVIVWERDWNNRRETEMDRIRSAVERARQIEES